jgi:hypothetical protein
MKSGVSQPSFNLKGLAEEALFWLPQVVYFSLFSPIYIKPDFGLQQTLAA